MENTSKAMNIVEKLGKQWELMKLDKNKIENHWKARKAIKKVDNQANHWKWNKINKIINENQWKSATHQ